MQAALEISESSKDEIIKRQSLEISCLSSMIGDHEFFVDEVIHERTNDFLKEIQRLSENNMRLQQMINNVLEAVRVLCKDEAERFKFLTAMGMVDEDWYRVEYPDVAEGYPHGGIHHFSAFGIFEGRKPNGFISF